MNIKRMICLAVCAGLMLVLFSGCSNNDTELETQDTIVSTAESSQETSRVTETEITTENTSETTAFNEVVELDPQLQSYANTFITNFVEQSFPDYDRETAGVEQMLDFVHIFLKINDSDSISYMNNGDLTFETFSIESVQDVTVKYLGLIISDEDYSGLPVPPETYGDQPAGPFFEDGMIWYEAADGEARNNIGIVDAINNPGDGTLNMEFTVYAIDLDAYLSLSADDIRAYYDLTPEQAQSDDTLQAVAEGTATVGVAQSGDYYLIDYSTSWN